MVEVDYDQLADFGGFDGHTPCLILFGIEAPWGKPLRIPRLPDDVLKTVKEVEAEILKIVERRPPESFTRPYYCGLCSLADYSNGRYFYRGKP